jgi:hypothetical protein
LDLKVNFWEELFPFLEKEKEREGGGTERHYNGLVPRQCPLVLLVEVMHIIGIIFYMTLEGLHYSKI